MPNSTGNDTVHLVRVETPDGDICTLDVIYSTKKNAIKAANKSNHYYKNIRILEIDLIDYTMKTWIVSGDELLPATEGIKLIYG